MGCFGTFNGTRTKKIVFWKDCNEKHFFGLTNKELLNKEAQGIGSPITIGKASNLIVKMERKVIELEDEAFKQRNEFISLAMAMEECCCEK